MALADYNNYAGRIHNLDAKIQLFNHYLVAKTAIKDIKNPFYPQKTAREVNTSGKQLCFGTPTKAYAQQKLTCLVLSL